MKRIKGFTLVELIIVIVIVGVLSIVAVPVYNTYTEKAILTEAKTLLGTIKTAEDAYYSEYRSYASTDELYSDNRVDVRGNKYFTEFAVDVSNYHPKKSKTGINYTTVYGLSESEAYDLTMTMAWGHTMSMGTVPQD